MGKIDFKKIGKDLSDAITKHSPEILIGFGITGMLTTTVLAVRATPKALESIEAKKKELKKDKLTAGETFKAAWKHYIPSAVTATASTACLIGSCKVSNKRNAVLATAYKIAENAHKEYRDKVIETIGEKKEAAIKDKVAQEKINKDPVSSKEVIITDRGNMLCYDSISGRYFKTDVDKIKRAVNEMNRRMTYNMYVSLNEFYSEIGLKTTNIGDDLGWNLDKGLIKIDYSSALTEHDEPCLVLNYNVTPQYDYYKLVK